MAETAETKKIVNPRVEIDTSPPFESVKEAVDRFGGSGPWIPHHLLRLAAAHHENEGFDVEKMEEQALQLERDLITKEKQTLNVLRELESAKRFVEGLKFNIMPEMSSFIPSPDRLSLCPALMFTELTQAKHNLNKTSLDLAAIQSSVDSLTHKLRKDKSSPAPAPPEPRHHQMTVPAPKDVPMSVALSGSQPNFESEQFRKMTEASRYEVMKAMAEIERTKNCIRMAEMRLNAAKKMEEAAKAVQAIAAAENGLSDELHQTTPINGITLSYEEYEALSSRAKQAEDTKFIDSDAAAGRAEAPVLEKFEEKTSTTKESFTKYKLRNSGRNPEVLNEGRDNGGFRSIGDVLSRKFVVQDDVMVGERQHVSLSQMLREQSRMILHPSKNGGEGNVEKQYFVQRKKFGFIQVPIPTKNSKKKAQGMNMR